MRIGLLSEPSNFHTRKWAENLSKSGAEVIIFSFEAYPNFEGVQCVQITPPLTYKNKENALSYLLSGKRLRKALNTWKIDIVFAINVTPFGIWVLNSGFSPFICFAIGADILEFPPDFYKLSDLNSRGWSNQKLELSFVSGVIKKIRYHYYRYWVSKVLRSASLILGDNYVLTDAIQQWFNIPEIAVRMVRGGVEPELFNVSQDLLNATKKNFRIPENKIIVLIPRGMKLIYQTDIILKGVMKFLDTGAGNVYFIILSSSYETPEEVAILIRELENKYPESVFFQETLIDRKAMYPLWCLTDIFISAPIYDGYSAVVAEGRYAGAIPVVNDTPATRELLTDDKDAWIVSPFTPENLLSALLALTNNLEAYKLRFSKKNKQWIQEHSLMQDSVKLLIKECENILN